MLLYSTSAHLYEDVLSQFKQILSLVFSCLIFPDVYKTWNTKNCGKIKTKITPNTNNKWENNIPLAYQTTILWVSWTEG